MTRTAGQHSLRLPLSLHTRYTYRAEAFSIGGVRHPALFYLNAYARLSPELLEELGMGPLDVWYGHIYQTVACDGVSLGECLKSLHTRAAWMGYHVEVHDDTYSTEEINKYGLTETYEVPALRYRVLLSADPCTVVFERRQVEYRHPHRVALEAHVALENAFAAQMRPLQFRWCVKVGRPR